jgi:hypothetical protein
VFASALVCAGCASWSARRAVLRGNQAIYDGIRARNADALREYAAADFRWHAPDGKIKNRDEWLASVAAIPGDIVSISGLRLTTEQRDDRLTVCGVQRAIVKLDGKEQIDDEPYCNDWQRRGGRWQVVESYVPTF